MAYVDVKLFHSYIGAASPGFMSSHARWLRVTTTNRLLYAPVGFIS